MNSGNSYTIDDDLLLNLPEKPGVYLFKDNEGRVIYIGKAKNLRARVSQYVFRTDSRAMIGALMAMAVSVEIIIANSETEALILENLLIKARQPFFNVELKDDKTYPYLAITDEEFPRLIVTRQITKKMQFVRGPFTQVGLMNSLKSLLQVLYPLKYCNDRRPKGCINYQIGLCPGPCMGKITSEQYMRNLKSVIEVLQGKKWRELSGIIKEKIEASANALNFENAAKLRDLLLLLPEMQKRYSVEFSGSGVDDCLCFRQHGDVLFAAVARYADGKLIYLKSLNVNGEFPTLDIWIPVFLVSFYSALGNHLPERLNIFPNVVGAEQISTLLGKSFKKIGAVGGDIRRMLEANLEQSVKVYLSETGKTAKTLSILSEFLQTEVSSICCIDISTLYGEYSVCGAVWWENGRFVRKKYKKFKIKTVSGIDDFGSLREVASRLLKHWQAGDFEKPSLLLIDGGAGQISSVDSILQGFLPIAGIIKDRKRIKGMELLLDKFGNELVLQDSIFALTLKSIRDESHRFSITYNRELRKNKLTSRLAEVRGVGLKRELALLERFGTLQKISEASAEELMQTSGITREIAENILESLKKEG